MDTPVAKSPRKNLDFSQALNLLKVGELIQRSGWNGKGMFLFIRPEFNCALEQFQKIISVPENAKSRIELIQRRGLEEVSAVSFKFTAYISMFAADGSIVNGWLASQTDMLAEDWQVVE